METVTHTTTIHPERLFTVSCQKLVWSWRMDCCCDNFVIGYFWSDNGRLLLASWRTLYREQVIRTSKLRHVRVTNALDTRPNRLLCSRGPLMAAVFAAILPKCSNLAVSTLRTIHSTRCLEHTPVWAVVPRTLNNSFVRCMEKFECQVYSWSTPKQLLLLRGQVDPTHGFNYESLSDWRALGLTITSLSW